MTSPPEPPVHFEASGGEAAVIAYNVPLPTSHTGGRMLEIDDIKKDVWSTEAKTTVEQIITDNHLANKTSGGYNVNIDAAFEYWKEQAMLAGMTSEECDNARAVYEQNASKKSTANK